MTSRRITLVIKPNDNDDKPELPLRHQLKCYLDYVGEIETGGAVSEIETEREFWISQYATASLEINDWKETTNIKITIKSAQGLILNIWPDEKPNAENKVVIELLKSHIDKTMALEVEDDLKFFDRKGQFLPLADSLPDKNK